jgi:hypothetical protein
MFGAHDSTNRRSLDFPAMKRKRNIQPKRKERISEIRIAFDKPQTITGMKVNDDGTLVFFGLHGEEVRPSHVEVGSAYLRPNKGHKVLTRQAVSPSEIQLTPNRSLLRFAMLCAVDTNTKVFNNRRISVAAGALLSNIQLSPTQWDAKLIEQDAFEFIDAEASPERIGWWEIICRLAVHPDVPRPVGLIVDSELSELASINAHQQPVIEEYFLPEGFELIYGCGERGTEEFITNAAIAHCDRIARQTIEKSKVEPTGIYHQSQQRTYARYRYWRARD